MEIKTEREQFSERLRLALNSAYPKGYKTSQIAIKFNLQHPNEPVTQQAVHKWLNGLAIPSKDKLQTLANWLNISPEWLRYGLEEQEYDVDEILSNLIKGLSKKQKKLLISVITEFK
ncbi:helix-turn-helix domain-containing protein [Rodentibacter haemolyticus]|uniref:Helix-turn-helix domain-containing protein n=1 Tax=Rodentibacter haemolyticus TaxID=2778911 RepID=A0ABX6UY67_9PAST|nr:helix-turn-helix domain-containing protein [Rodentibacter haemolyticus]QPB43022.1 helix-turn-helix domain-containing protein [Rodentibacter haemolyticus]